MLPKKCRHFIHNGMELELSLTSYGIVNRERMVGFRGTDYWRISCEGMQLTVFVCSALIPCSHLENSQDFKVSLPLPCLTQSVFPTLPHLSALHMPIETISPFFPLRFPFFIFPSRSPFLSSTCQNGVARSIPAESFPSDRGSVLIILPALFSPYFPETFIYSSFQTRSDLYLTP